MEEKRVSSVMGWFRQLFGKQKADSDQDRLRDCELSGHSSSTSSISVSSSSSSSHPHPPSLSSSSSSQPPPSVLSSSFRSSRPYDVCLCHAQTDTALAQSLTSFLEHPTKGLRVFLPERDCPLGGAVSAELLQAVRDSHFWVLLVSPDFLKDEWCLYQMHQMLSEGPMSQRLIPAVLNMPRSGLPHELRFLYTIDLNTDTELGFSWVYRTVLDNLKDMSKKEKPSIVSQSDGSETQESETQLS